MDHIPTDIFEDLLNDVVGNRYSGPPLAASDLRVLSGPQPPINITKAADDRFNQHAILGQRRQYDKGFPNIQTYSHLDQNQGLSRSLGFSGLGATRPTNRASYTPWPSFVSPIRFVKPDNAEYKNGASAVKKWPTSDANATAGASHTITSAAISGIDFSKIQTFSHRDQDQGHSQSLNFSGLQATRPTNRDSFTARPSFISPIRFVKPDNAEYKDGASATKILPTSDANATAGASHTIDTSAAISGIDTQLADPECLLLIKNLLQYSYNKWRVKNYDAAKPQFWFLFENTSEEYKYYRLKLTQLLKLKNATADAKSQVTDFKASVVKDFVFQKLKKTQTSTVGTQTDLKMDMLNRSLADVLQYSPKQSPAVPELLNSQSIALQHPAPSKMVNAPEAFHKDERDATLTTFTTGHTLQPNVQNQKSPAPTELLSHQRISKNTIIPCPSPATTKTHLASQKQKLMETIKPVTTKLHVNSRSPIDVQFKEIDEITKKALQNLANVFVLSQEQNRRLEMKGPAYWFLKEKLSPVYKYYRMKITELRQARGLPDDNSEFENHSQPLDVEVTEPQVSEADHPESQGSEAVRPEALSWEFLQSEPDKFELLVTCSDDEESDGEDSSPLIRETGQPQVRVPKSHQPDEKLSLQNLEPHSSVLHDASSQPPQAMKSDSTSEEAKQITTVKQSPVSRKRGLPPKEVAVSAKRIHPAKQSRGSFP